ncbi:NAD-dependent DNA ligase LigA (plasmid) [Paenibacillus thiaminolyticus]|uniref:NAD-dependent DNA ligase LigA n=1 Tax=Paenibacillus thiaminolyticus TaxID=49283 RepID=UPI00232CCB0C|nr:NAD-dependent DNA ligase LigA [Paenibacillus thiaminolyticus]WCF11428.1 NAD-dependent DNA ligase LigA [Paenibacillus thiaminolyticus]
MDKVQAKERIKYLRGSIKKHDELYDQNKPIISDGEYDTLYYELLDLEKQYPEFFDPDSPTQRIYTTMVDELEKVRHSTFMGSQEKVKNWEGVLSFEKRYESPILAQPKLDGLTIVLSYDNGILFQGITRGDGEVGQNIIHTVRTIQNLPSIIPFKGRLEVRMEGIIPFTEFERINVDGAYSNPRNLVSGTLSQLNAKIAEERNVQGIVFDIISIEGMTFTSISEELEFLKAQGFTTVDSVLFEQTEAGLSALKLYIENMEQNVRKSLPYMIDGLVLKFDKLSAKEELGSTSKHPRWSVAYKFASLEATTRIKGVEHSVGRTGQITPVALLEKVDIDGVNVGRASLANYGTVEEKDIRIGDRVFVIRANDVIPKVEASIKEVRNGSEEVILAPKHCPVCGAPTEFDGANLFCRGKQCKPQIQGKIEHFASRKALNINSLGKSTVELFLEKGIICEVLDLYDLQEKEEEICALDGYGKKSFMKLQKELERVKTEPLHKVLISLSIERLGETKSKDLSKVFTDMDALLSATEDPENFRTLLLKIPDFGNTIADSVITFFTNEENRNMLLKMKEIGFTMKSDFESRDDNNLTLAGETVVVTGTLNSMDRDAAKTKLEEMGAKVSSSISKKTSFVVVGEGKSKHAKAIELGVRVVFEEEFLQMIQAN